MELRYATQRRGGVLGKGSAYSEEAADDRENYDGGDGDDNAVERELLARFAHGPHLVMGG